jgi:hypothetical protein
MPLCRSALERENVWRFSFPGKNVLCILNIANLSSSVPHLTEMRQVAPASPRFLFAPQAVLALTAGPHPGEQTDAAVLRIGTLRLGWWRRSALRSP